MESVEGGDAAPDGRTPLQGMQDMLAGVEQDREVVAADRTQWLDVLALLVS